MSELSMERGDPTAAEAGLDSSGAGFEPRIVAFLCNWCT
jgi:hypothetical protein